MEQSQFAIISLNWLLFSKCIHSKSKLRFIKSCSLDDIVHCAPEREEDSAVLLSLTHLQAKAYNINRIGRFETFTMPTSDIVRSQVKQQGEINPQNALVLWQEIISHFDHLKNTLFLITSNYSDIESKI